MLAHGELRIEPPPGTLSASRAWSGSIRSLLADDFLASYLTGSVLTQGFDAKRSRINVLVVARELPETSIDALRDTMPVSKKAPSFDPLFLTRAQIEKSLDTFPIEWLEIQERNLLLEGEDIFQNLEVPRTYLRLQCEHELRGKYIQLRQTYLMSGQDSAVLAQTLKSTASSFATLFRTLLRLSGETPPAENGRVIERTAELFKIDAQGLLEAHLVRYSGRRYKPDEILTIYRRFLAQIDRLVNAIDQLRVT